MSKLIESNHYQSQGAYINEEESLWRVARDKADVFLFYLLLSKLNFLKAPIVFEDFI